MSLLHSLLHAREEAEFGILLGGECSHLIYDKNPYFATRI
jgi:hypothetical protein